MRRNSFLILSAFTLLIASCGKKGGKSGLMVPKDAAMAVHINSASLSSKLSWEEIRQTYWFKEMSKEAKDTLAQQLLADPASSGIDTKGDFVFYIKKHGKGSYMVFEGSLKSAADYEKLLKEVNKEDQKEIKKDGDFSYMVSSESGVIVWNKSMFAVVANAGMPDMPSMMGMGMGMGRSYGDSRPHEFLTDSLRIFGQQALTLKNSDNLDTDSRFADLVKDGSDMHFWMNAGEYYGDMSSMEFPVKLNVLFDGNVSAMSFNFDNGKITAKAKHYYGPEMDKLVAAHRPQPISADVLNRIPSQDVAAVIAFNYPPQGLKELIRVIGADGLANGFLSKINYSVDEFVKANKGEVVLALTDFSMVKKQDTVDFGNGMKPYVRTSTQPDMKVLFATSVNDKAAFEKLITIAWDASKEITDKARDFPSISYKLENNWFAASNSQEMTEKFLAGGNSNLPFISKITGHPFGMYIDINKIIRSAAGPMAGGDSSSSESAAVDISLKMWQDIVGSGGDYKDKVSTSEFEINLVDKSTNSLKQLNQYIDKLATLQMERRKKFMEDIDAPKVEPAD